MLSAMQSRMDWCPERYNGVVQFRARLLKKYYKKKIKLLQINRNFTTYFPGPLWYSSHHEIPNIHREVYS